MRHSFFLLIAFVGLVACESAVEVDIPRGDTKLTANAFFTPDSVWSVELSQNRYILDSDLFGGLPEATVEVWQEERLIAELPYQTESAFEGHSVYRTNDAYPKEGIPYTLRVSHPNYPTVAASSLVPAAPIIIGGTLDVLDVRRDGPLNNNQIAYGLTLRLDDLPEENFYSLSLVIRSESFGTTGEGEEQLLLLEEGTSFVDIRSDDPVVDNTFDNYRDELLFKDVSFNGEQYELKLYTVFETDDPKYIRLFDGGFVLQEDAYDREGNIVRQAGDTAGVNTLCAVLRNATEAYYQYNYTRDLQSSVENNPFAQPVQVFDNIENGLGIFAGYNQAEKKITIP